MIGLSNAFPNLSEVVGLWNLVHLLVHNILVTIIWNLSQYSWNSTISDFCCYMWRLLPISVQAHVMIYLYRRIVTLYSSKVYMLHCRCYCFDTIFCLCQFFYVSCLVIIPLIGSLVLAIPCKLIEICHPSLSLAPPLENLLLTNMFLQKPELGALLHRRICLRRLGS